MDAIDESEKSEYMDICQHFERMLNAKWGVGVIWHRRGKMVKAALVEYDTFKPIVQLIPDMPDPARIFSVEKMAMEYDANGFYLVCKIHKTGFTFDIPYRDIRLMVEFAATEPGAV